MSEQQNSTKKKRELESLRKKNRIIIEIKLFFENLLALKDSFPDLIKKVENKYVYRKKEFETSLRKYGIENKKEKIFKIPQRYIKLIDKQYFEYQKSTRAYLKTIPESLVVSLISIFDGYLCNLVKMYLKNDSKLLLYNPILNEDDEDVREKIKSIDFKEIFKYETVDEIKDYLIDKEVDSFSRGDHSRKLKWLEKKFNFTIDTDLFDIPQFIELTERRNLYVHNDGRISNQYLIKCEKYKVQNINNLKSGHYLPVSNQYFFTSFDVIFEAGIKLAHLIWRKVIPRELELADLNLAEDICFKLLEEGDYKRAMMLLDFAVLKLKSYYSEEYRRIYVINRSLAYKLSGNKTESLNIINSEDWSASDDRFKLAVDVIKERYNEASIYMKKLGNKSDLLHQSSYVEWPLFKDFRKSQVFLKTYKEIFKEDLKKYLKKRNH